MTCLNPIFVRPIKSVATCIKVPCGSCPACLASKRRQWAYRMEKEMENNDYTYFIRLSYDDEHMPLANTLPTLSKSDCQLFFKRLRKNTPQFKFRYYLCGEYGSKTLRPHYHIMLFCKQLKPIKLKPYEEIIDYIARAVTQNWNKGYISITYPSIGRIMYTAKYITKTDRNNYRAVEQPFSLVSRRPGIGECAIASLNRWYETAKDKRYRTVVQTVDFCKCALPKYYKQKFKGDKKLSLRELEELHNEQLKTDLQQSKYLEKQFFDRYPKATYSDYYNYRLKRYQEHIDYIDYKQSKLNENE